MGIAFGFVAFSAVALFTRAWIEINFGQRTAKRESVALFTRAWIEIMKLDTPLIDKKASPSLRGRGLK